MRATKLRVLVAAAVVVGVLAYLVVNAAYGDLPPLPGYAPASLLFLSIAEAVTARSIRRRFARRPGVLPVNPLTVARLAALAKASSLAGALVLGGYAGILVYTLARRQELVAARSDARTSGLGIAASVALVAAALWLEHSCRTPDRPDRPAPPTPAAPRKEPPASGR